MDDDVILQMGLLLNQLRYTRHALEGIERATTRYAGLALQMTGGSTPWGAPPMFEGSLKVYVVNISDLTAGQAVGDVVAGVLGGAGRFLGGFAGGAVGGFRSALAFPALVRHLDSIMSSLDRILARIGTASGNSAASSTSILDQAGSIAALLREVTALFTGAVAAPAGDSATGSAGSITASLGPALALAQAANRLVDGLIIAVPILVGAIGWLLNNMNGIELAILDLMGFALRAGLLLRAAILGIVLDTLALVGQLAATTMGLIITALDTIIPAAFRLLVVGLDSSLTVLQVASSGLARLVDGLMRWLRDGLGSMLIFIGTLRVFRLLEHLVQIAPAVLPAIARLKGTPLTVDETKALSSAAGTAALGGRSGGVTVPTISAAPDVVGLAMPPAARAALLGAVSRFGDSVRAEAHTGLAATQSMLGGIGTTMRSAVDGLDANLNNQIAQRAQAAGNDVSSLTAAMEQARQAARTSPRTGLEAIAGAYESWLHDGGMRTLMSEITEHLRTAPTGGSDVERSIPGRTVSAVLADAGDRRVVVQIGEVVIELGAAPTDGSPPGSDLMLASFDLDPSLKWHRELHDRAGDVAAL
jgi:hypothetical protein